MTKIVINTCYGGFSLSDAAMVKYSEYRGLGLTRSSEGLYRDTENEIWSRWDFERDDPILVQVVEELKREADGSFANLKVVEIPDGVEWDIEEYDGQEWIAEKHRVWR